MKKRFEVKWIREVIESAFAVQLVLQTAIKLSAGQQVMH